MRSSSCIVLAVKYDSPQAEHDHIGTASTTNNVAPDPKLRVTLLIERLLLPQFAQGSSTEVDRDDVETAGRTDFGDRFSSVTGKGCALDDVLDFARRPVTLTFNDLAREDDVFEVEDAEVVIVKFVRCVGGNGVGKSTDQMANLGDGYLCHSSV